MDAPFAYDPKKDEAVTAENGDIMKGELYEGIAPKILAVPTDFRDKPRKDQRMKSVVVE